MNNLRLTLVQTQLNWEDPAANLSRFEKLLTPLSGQTDLIILPEMFTTGFSMAAAKLAEPMDGPTVKWLQKQAQKTGAAITGSLIIHANGEYYNRLLWVEPEGRILHYDKRHLFGMAGEHEYYTAGTERLIVDYKDWRICPLVCYDLRFPIWSRNTDNYDLLIYLASWPAPRAADWRTLLAARSIENQCYVAGVNRIGDDDNGHHYRGDSCVIDPGPKRVLYQSAEVESIITLTINKKELIEFRKKLPFLADIS